jgi:hypothetical protein
MEHLDNCRKFQNSLSSNNDERTDDSEKLYNIKEKRSQRDNKVDVEDDIHSQESGSSGLYEGDSEKGISSDDLSETSDDEDDDEMSKQNEAIFTSDDDDALYKEVERAHRKIYESEGEIKLFKSVIVL